MLENALNDTANRQTKRQSNYTKFQVFAWMVINSINKNLNQSGNYHKYAHKLSSKSLYLARIRRPDILWSVNKLARAVTKWTQACDRRLARLISDIIRTSDYRQYCHVGNTAQHCRLGLFQDSDFAGDLEDSKSTSGGIFCIFGSWTLVSLNLICKRHTSVSPSSTESEAISLDARLRPGSFVVRLWRQRSCDQDDHSGLKSNKETRFKNSQSCVRLVVWQNQFGSKSNMLTPKPTCWHANQR